MPANVSFSLSSLARSIVLERLVISAERRANREARFSFDYDGLRSLLGDVRQHIDIYLEIERRQPRDLISDVEG